MDDETIVPLREYERQQKRGRTVRIVRGTDFASEAPERRWHVDPLIPANTVTLLGGDGGTGKSLLSMQLAVATAAPRSMKWCGRTVANGSVIYLSAEDDVDELHRRVRSIAEFHEIDIGDLERLAIVPLAGEDAVLAAPDRASLKPTPLFEAIEARIIEERPALIIADTLADLSAGDENVRSHARQFIGMLRGWCIRHDTTVLLLSHPSVSGISSGSGTSGSTGWSNSVRSRLYLDRIKAEDGFEPDPNARVLKTMKANYGPIGGEIHLRWEDGVFVVIDTGSTSSFSAMAERAKAERVFLDLVEAFKAEGRRVSPQPSANYAPVQFSRDPRSEGLNKRALTDAMGRLFAAKRIRVAEEGPPTRRRSTIEVIP